jgi:hypothetical protein
MILARIMAFFFCSAFFAMMFLAQIQFQAFKAGCGRKTGFHFSSSRSSRRHPGQGEVFLRMLR